MTPTLLGRVQSRLFVVCTAALLWTLLLTPLLAMGFMPLSDAYAGTLSALAAVLVLGTVLWEPLYHFLQQFRWEKDWPAMFTLIEGVPEGVLVYVVLTEVLGLDVPGWPFVIHFATAWLIVFLCLHGPMRVLFLRWRFRGGRLI
jgi:hypothetical protein